MLDSLIKDYNQRKFILASASPRRAELLKNIGMSFDVVISAVDEDILSAGDIAKGLENNARKKGLAVAKLYPDAIVISADTVVVLDEHVMGKPENREEASAMLQRLNGRIHSVMTAFGLIFYREQKSFFEIVTTRVKFRKLEMEEINAYIQSGEPYDKAGAYAIQGVGSLLIDTIEGCYFNVVGFPISKFFTALHKFCGELK